MLVREMPEAERPTARMQRLGVEVLSNAELIQVAAMLPNLDAAHALAARFGFLTNMADAPLSELEGPGIGKATASAIKAAIELGRRASLEATARTLNSSITSPGDAARYLYQIPELARGDQEHLVVMLLNTRNKPIGHKIVYRGNVHASIVRGAEVFREALRVNAPAIIICHNHPSGDPSPSTEDVSLTVTLVEAGKLLDIEVVDHIVIGSNVGGHFVSMKERGLGSL